METETGPLTFDRDAWAADPTRTTRERYGDIFRLDAFPWVVGKEALEKRVLERQDTYDGLEGQVARSWRVSGGSNGLPLETERRLHLELLLKTAAAEWSNYKIEFTYRDLALALGLIPTKQSHARIDLALDRLLRVNIKFEGESLRSTGNRFGVSTSFDIFQGLDIIAEGDEKAGILSWNRCVFASLKSSVGPDLLRQFPSNPGGLEETCHEHQDQFQQEILRPAIPIGLDFP